ncbi:hypothetical protein FACS189434_11640 [Bacteroidia bacterium]|nr:hypothetical protein FACS189434_11640 [Bacteroidia bacterium]
MKQRIYIDTSVFGGYYDTEFEKHTIPFFDRIRNDEFTVLFSTITEEELEKAPQNVRDLVKEILSKDVEFLLVTDEAVDLATEYITEKVVGKTSLSDCLHIALATVHRADFLISWNFKHIVNVQRIRGYNAINIKNGYKQLDIHSPLEFQKI